jgi:hypothetical protein
MSGKTLIFNLVQPAKKSGGDKYTCETDETFTIYVPQSISRPEKEPLKILSVTIGGCF